MKLQDTIAFYKNRRLQFFVVLTKLSSLFNHIVLNQGHSGATPETFGNAYCTIQGAKEDDSQSDRHAEAGTSQSQITQNSGPEAAHDGNQRLLNFIVVRQSHQC